MNGVLYGVGVGPGDPGLLTIKAVKTIESADVLYIPHKDADKCRAVLIVKEAVPGARDKQIMSCDFDMIPDDEARRARHEEIYRSVRDVLSEGKTVAFITIGDPAIYSTFSYIADLARKDGADIRIISGISSPAECAASLGISLCEGDEQLHVIPGSGKVEYALGLPGTKVIMKCGKDLARIKKSIAGYIKESRTPISVYAVSECGTRNEKCYRGLDELPDSAGYLTTVIIKEDYSTS